MRVKLLVIVLICISGCALFQKTSKMSSVGTQSSVNQLESSQLVLKSTGKETQIYTYWNDSGFYQYQHIKEQIDQAKLSSTKAEQKQQAKQTVTAKKTERVNTGIYGAILITLVIGYLIWRKSS